MKWFFLAVLVFHGLIHLMGFVNELGLVKVGDESAKTLFPVPIGWKKPLGILWFLATVFFLAASIGLILGSSWWRAVVIAAVVVSQVLIVIWWPSAKFGTMPNALILVGLYFLK